MGIKAIILSRHLFIISFSYTWKIAVEFEDLKGLETEPYILLYFKCYISSDQLLLDRHRDQALSRENTSQSETRR